MAPCKRIGNFGMAREMGVGTRGITDNFFGRRENLDERTLSDTWEGGGGRGEGREGEKRQRRIKTLIRYKTSTIFDTSHSIFRLTFQEWKAKRG